MFLVLFKPNFLQSVFKIKSSIFRAGITEPIQIQKKTDKRGVDFTNAHNVRCVFEKSSNHYQQKQNTSYKSYFAGYIQYILLFQDTFDGWSKEGGKKWDIITKRGIIPIVGNNNWQAIWWPSLHAKCRNGCQWWFFHIIMLIGENALQESIW